MLSEGIRRHSRGEDVAIGVVRPTGARELPNWRPNSKPYRGVAWNTKERPSTKWMWMRSSPVGPESCWSDELAHTNIEGSNTRSVTKYAMELLDANIDVMSTMNVQHIESLMPMVQRITGIQVRETVPDWVMQRVSEIVLADLTPEALQTRMRRGDIYPLDRAERALGNFFRPGNLLALRELALQQVTRAVDRSLESYMEKEEGGKSVGVHERIAVCVSSSPAAENRSRARPGRHSVLHRNCM